MLPLYLPCFLLVSGLLGAIHSITIQSSCDTGTPLGNWCFHNMGTTCYNHGYIYIYVMYPLRKVGTALLISFWDKAIGFQLEPENWFDSRCPKWVAELLRSKSKKSPSFPIINLPIHIETSHFGQRFNQHSLRCPAERWENETDAMELHRRVPPEKRCVTYKDDGWHCSIG